jgi:hypothetical protein
MVAQMDHGDLSLYPPLQNGLGLANIFIGKTNQHGRIEYGAALRHRDYKSCLVGAIATYFVPPSPRTCSCGSTREEDPHLVAVVKAVPAMAERLRPTAATVEAGNVATTTALEDLRAELAGVKASLQDFVQGRFSFTFTPARSRMLPQGWDPLLSQGQGRPVSPPSPSPRGRPP